MAPPPPRGVVVPTHIPYEDQSAIEVRKGRRWPIVAAALGGSLVAALLFSLGGGKGDKDEAREATLAATKVVPTDAAAEDLQTEEPPPVEVVEPSLPPTAPPMDAAPEPVEIAEVELVVRSTPVGASVELAGISLGTTPLRLAVARAEDPVALRLQLDGYREHTQFVDLSAKGPVAIRERLRKKAAEPDPSPPTSRIDIFVKPWANVYFRGLKIAEAPARGIRLPHGTHRLRLENPVTGQKRTVTVEVPSSKPYRFTLQGGS